MIAFLVTGHLASRADARPDEPVPSDGLVPSSRKETPPNIEAGQADYALYCASCHGEQGNGDGLLADALEPRPARFSDPALLGARSDAYLYQIIEQGGASLGRSEQMAAWGGTLASSQIVNLVAFLRSMAASSPPSNPPN